MKLRMGYLVFVTVLCVLALGCSRIAERRPEPGTLEAAAYKCRQIQQKHHQNAGFSLRHKESADENEIIHYRVYEGVPNFSMRECMEQQWPEG